MAWEAAAAAAAPGIISGISGIFGGKGQKKAAGTAAGQEVAAQQAGINALQQYYGQGMAALSPFVSSGQQALGALGQMFGFGAPAGAPAGAGGNALQAYQAFTQTPFYQFPLGQAQQGFQRGAAASGLAMTPGMVGGLEQLGAGYSGQQFGNYMNQLQTLATRGAGAAGTLMDAATGMGRNVLGAMTGIGQSQAGGTIGGQNALSQALSYLPLALTGGNVGTGGLGGAGSGGGGLLGGLLKLFGGGGNALTSSEAGMPSGPSSGVDALMQQAYLNQ